MPIQVESDIKLVFKDGSCFVPLQDQWVDLMKLDSIAEVRTVLVAIASETLSRSMSEPANPAEATLLSDNIEPVPDGPDLGGYAEKIRKSFQDTTDRAQDRLNELTNQHRSANAAQASAAQG